jgi:hypothetical protein
MSRCSISSMHRHVPPDEALGGGFRERGSLTKW